MKSRNEIWSFFTGAGGLDLGLGMAGLNATLAVEIDADCCDTLKRNRPKLDVWQTDISSLDADTIRERRQHDSEVLLTELARTRIEELERKGILPKSK